MEDSKTRAHDATAQPAASGFALGQPEFALEAMSRHTGDCVKLLDLDGVVMRWNSSCEEFYGWKADEVLGERLPHVPRDLRLRTLHDLRTIAASGRVVERESEQQRADGTRVAVRLVLIPVHDEDRNPAGILSLAREVGEDTRLERQREDFIGAVSRELRDPLVAAAGFAQLLQRPEIRDDSSRRGRTLAALAERIDATLTVLDDLLMVSEVRQGPLPIEPVPVDLASVVSDVVARLGDRAGRVMLDFDTSIARVEVDVSRFGRAVSKVIENALECSPSESLVGVSVYAVGDEAVVEVTDTGRGIDPADRERIFDELHGWGADGLGAGLHLARVVVEAHGGTITVASQPGAGSSFALRLPLGEPMRRGAR